MWIFMNNSFLSAVTHREKPGFLNVRGRLKGDIEAVFPNAQVTETPNRDYRFRAAISKEEVAKAIAAKIEAIDYGNFKDSVKEQDRHEAYFEAWHAMASLQGERVRKAIALSKARLAK